MTTDKYHLTLGAYQMTPSKQACAAGLDSLAEVSRMTGVSIQTLCNWHKNKENLFAAVLRGCASMKESVK